MGWVSDCFKWTAWADVYKDDLAVTFCRRYKDARDEMCDCVKPQWEPVDDFIIRIYERHSFTTSHTCGGAEYTTYHIEETGNIMEIRTKDKRLANWVWYLAKKRGYTFGQFKAMDEEGVFK